ncbi:MAG: hypothetical protein K8R02_09830 [Anaerohalosphaeraceae bacterium]|nr:hypothetical protein [Anaerohalosphaeraceae bacterium]
MIMEMNEYFISDLTVGQSDKISVDVTLDDIDRFAELSGDYSSVHMDSDFAMTKGYEGRIAHGMLTGAFISSFIGMRLPGRIGIMTNMDIDFKKPIVPPDRIRIEGEIVDISMSVNHVLIKVKVFKGNGELVAIAKVRSVVREK